MDLKEQIKQYISIVDVASLYVTLKPAGKNMKALCPFHTEKTPSFFVQPERNSFSCFGCNRFGDIFTLVQEMEGIGFREAMDFLIDRFQVPVQREAGEGQKKDEYFQITEWAMGFFQNNLRGGGEGDRAGEYLRKRGITRETVKTFDLGYASNSWDELSEHLRSRGVPVDKAVELGLLVRNEKGRIYDRFRGRIIFPICSESGIPLAFGGRALGDEEPKYLNSPESPIYKKGNHLYGFHLAKDEIRKKKAAVLVEGYMDLISLKKAGIGHVVASLGTALTEKQVYLLKRFTETIYLFYDSDAAGIQAAMRGLEKLFELNINPYVILDRDVKDPDELISKKGVDAFEEACKQAKDGFQFFLLQVSGRFDLKRPEMKKMAVDTVMAVVQRITDPIVRDGYLQRTADFFRIDPALLRPAVRTSQAPAEQKAQLRIGTDEREFLVLLLTYPTVISELRDLLTADLLSVLNCRSLIDAMVKSSDSGEELSFTSVAALLNENERALLNQLILQRDAEIRPYDTALKSLEACLVNFIKKARKKKSKSLTREIAQMEREEKWTRVRKLMEQKSQERIVSNKPN